jgi:hypothetical protein
MNTTIDCVTHAVDAYLKRANSDTNPSIVQLLLPDGKFDSHWYYRSDQVVSTSVFDWPELFPAYEGPIDALPENMQKHFVQGRFAVNNFLTKYAHKALEEGFKTYNEVNKKI